MTGLLTAAGLLTCTYCGCSDDAACMLESGEPCSWAQLHPPVCSAPDCVAASFVAGTAEPLVALTAMRSALRWSGLL